MKKFYIALLSIVLLASCDDPSKIQVQSKLSKATIVNVEWGGVPISNQILPGQTSSTIKIFDDSYYDINLPASYPVKFYIDLNGDKMYVQTRKSYRLGKEDEITIVIEDTTNVFNPLLENNQ